MIEYKTIHDSTSNIQKKLNQWRHQYTLEVLHFVADSDGKFAVLLVRAPLEEE